MGQWLMSDASQVHIDATKENEQTFQTTRNARKLMHRFTEQELESAMDEAAKSTA